MTPEKKCEHCGARLKEWWHTLSPGLVRTLIKVVEAVKKSGENDFHLQVNGEMNNNEFSNFPKLRVHGLVARVTNDKGIAAAHWLLTSKAGKFLRGEIHIPKKVKTFRGKVVGHSEELTHISEYRNQVGWFEQDFDFEIHENKIQSLNKNHEKSNTQNQHTSVDSGRLF